MIIGNVKACVLFLFLFLFLIVDLAHICLFERSTVDHEQHRSQEL